MITIIVLNYSNLDKDRINEGTVNSDSAEESTQNLWFNLIYRIN